MKNRQEWSERRNKKIRNKIFFRERDARIDIDPRLWLDKNMMIAQQEIVAQSQNGTASLATN